jgi:hypothetical protein
MGLSLGGVETTAKDSTYSTRKNNAQFPAGDEAKTAAIVAADHLPSHFSELVITEGPGGRQASNVHRRRSRTTRRRIYPSQSRGNRASHYDLRGMR